MASFKNIAKNTSENASYSAYKKLTLQDVAVTYYVAKKQFTIEGADLTSNGIYSFLFGRTYTIVPPSPSPTPSITRTPSPSPTVTPTVSTTPSPSVSLSPTPSNTPTPTPSSSPASSVTPSNTPTPSVTPTFTPTPTATSNCTFSLTVSVIPSP